jgi:hypothetical protein
MQSLTRRRQIAACAVTLALGGLTACGGDNSAQNNETKAKLSNFGTVSKNQPPAYMPYSPTRATINAWANWWKVPGRLSYCYVVNANGDAKGYYIFTGPPVGMNVGITEPTQWKDIPGDGGDTKTRIEAPSLDSAFYGAGQGNSYYGTDVKTGRPIQFTVGLGVSLVIYPFPNPVWDNANALGPTTLKEAKNR